MYDAKTGHGPHSNSGTAASPMCPHTVVHLQDATMPLPPPLPKIVFNKVKPPVFPIRGLNRNVIPLAEAQALSWSTESVSEPSDAVIRRNDETNPS
jgi:hypothetical protein